VLKSPSRRGWKKSTGIEASIWTKRQKWGPGNEYAVVTAENKGIGESNKKGPKLYGGRITGIGGVFPDGLTGWEGAKGPNKYYKGAAKKMHPTTMDPLFRERPDQKRLEKKRQGKGNFLDRDRGQKKPAGGRQKEGRHGGSHEPP